jgi:hypothetical protein
MAPSTFVPKAKHTNGELAILIAEVHECVHKVGEDVKAAATAAAEANANVAKLDSRLSRIEGYQEGLAKRFGVPDPHAPPPTMLVRYQRPLKTLIGAVAVVFASASAFAAAYPLLRTLFAAADRFLMGVR